MRRTLDQIRQSINERGINETGLSTSKAAEWLTLKEMFAYAVWMFELVLELFRADVANRIQLKQPPTKDWYYDKILAFQDGDSLIIDSNGLLGYPSIDAEKRVVSQALLIEQEVGDSAKLQVKVAQEDTPGKFSALSETSLDNLKAYIKAIKAPGTRIETTSGDGDNVKYTVVVLQDPIYSPNDVSDNVLQALDDYRAGVNFVSSVYKSRLIAAILQVPGVVACAFTYLEGVADGESLAGTGVFDFYQLDAGYFNFDDDSSITITTSESDLTP